MIRTLYTCVSFFVLFCVFFIIIIFLIPFSLADFMIIHRIYSWGMVPHPSLLATISYNVSESLYVLGILSLFHLFILRLFFWIFKLLTNVPKFIDDVSHASIPQSFRPPEGVQGQQADVAGVVVGEEGQQNRRLLDGAGVGGQHHEATGLPVVGQAGDSSLSFIAAGDCPRHAVLICCKLICLDITRKFFIL